ncbi:hypothetical protein ACVWW1_008950 [Bradyrhizobium sp. JR3.5]
MVRSEFRADLYYRINVVPLLLPPLRERRSDIPLLASEFLRNFNNKNGRTLTLEASAIDVLMNCGFPGNVRELENCIERTATLSAGPSIVRNDFACCHGQCFSATLWKSTSDKMIMPPVPSMPVPARSITPLSEATAPSPIVGSELASLTPPPGTALVGGAKMGRSRAGHCGHGKIWLGAGKGSALAGTNAAPDWLCAEEIRNRDQAILNARASAVEAATITVEANSCEGTSWLACVRPISSIWMGRFAPRRRLGCERNDPARVAVATRVELAWQEVGLVGHDCRDHHETVQEC